MAVQDSASRGDEELRRRLRVAGLPVQLDYSTGDVARILGTSRETVRQLILKWEPPGIPGRNPAGLFARKLSVHHRVPHEALADWLRSNTVYERETA
jgi:transposase